ncbi:MAG: hypothetical protein U0792_18815 [Gemmataceae bacterium]
MTEEQWFATDDLDAMLRRLRNTRRGPKVSTRKLLFTAHAIAVTVPDLLVLAAAVRVLRLAEEAAESGMPPAVVGSAREQLLGEISFGWASALCRTLLAIVDPTKWDYYLPEDHLASAASYARMQLGERAASLQTALLRDIVGNPFRPATFSREWRTSTAVGIAKGMYESRDFDVMPILADALQDAGCDNADILNHCRDPQQVHVRGCWVVDSVLGKS